MRSPQVFLHGDDPPMISCQSNMSLFSPLSHYLVDYLVESIGIALNSSSILLATHTVIPFLLFCLAAYSADWWCRGSLAARHCHQILCFAPPFIIPIRLDEGIYDGPIPNANDIVTTSPTSSMDAFIWPIPLTGAEEAV